MSRVILLFLLLSCFGCTGKGWYIPFGEPAMQFAVLKDNGWSIFAKTRETWKPHYRDSLPFQQYFSKEHMGSYPFARFNFFYAIYPLDSGEELALYVDIPFSFTRYPYTRNSCSEISQMVAISTNTPHVSFDAGSVSLLINTDKIVGSEIRYTIATPLKDMRVYDHGVYDLASAETVANRQFRANYPAGRPVPFPTFYFRFPVDCKDFEDAVLFIDGFTTQEGKRLPPLKVRLNYYDFDEVPKL